MRLCTLSTMSAPLLLVLIAVGPTSAQFNIFGPFVQAVSSFTNRIQGFFGVNIEDVDDGALPIMMRPQRTTTERQPVFIEAEPLHQQQAHSNKPTGAVDVLVIDNSGLNGQRVEDYESYAHYG